MKYSEFKKAVESLSKHYEVKNRSGLFRDSVLIEFKGKAVGIVHAGVFNIQVMNDFGTSISYSKKLYMLMAKFSMTPTDERKDHRWNVIIGRETRSDELSAYAIGGISKAFYVSNRTFRGSLGRRQYVFTDGEFNRLIAQLKSLPDGYRLAKIAELGKVPAPEVEK